MKDLYDPQQIGLHLLFIPEELRRARRRRVRHLPRLGADGGDRPRHRHRRPRHLPRHRPDHGRRHARAEGALDGPHRRGGPARAYGATEPQAGSDLAALTTDGGAGRGGRRGRRATASPAASSGSATAASPTSTRSSPTPPAGRPGSSSSGAPRASRTASPRTSTASAPATPRRSSSRTSYVPADRLVGGVEGQGLAQAQAVFGYTRLMVAAFGLGAGWAALQRAIRYSQQRVQAGGAAQPEAGLHAQADRARTRCGSRPRAPTSSGRPSGSTPASRTSRPRARSPSTSPPRPATRPPRTPSRRTAATATRGVHGREDQARRAHHHHLRGHLRDHGVDHRARPLAAAPEEPRRATTTTGRRRLEARHAQPPNVGAGAAALALRALAALLERCRLDRLTRNQHVLFRLGELIAYAETRGDLRRARRRSKPTTASGARAGDAAGDGAHLRRARPR